MLAMLHCHKEKIKNHKRELFVILVREILTFIFKDVRANYLCILIAHEIHVTASRHVMH